MPALALPPLSWECDSREGQLACQHECTSSGYVPTFECRSAAFDAVPLQDAGMRRREVRDGRVLVGRLKVRHKLWVGPGVPSFGEGAASRTHLGGWVQSGGGLA